MLLMKPRACFTLILYLAFCPLAKSMDDPAPGEEWVPLFNGKNLEGWYPVNDAGLFHVQQGELIGTYKAGKGSFLISEGQYDDFILEYDMYLEAEGLNSGVQLRSHLDKGSESGRVTGMQVECDGEKRRWTGGIYDQDRHGWLYSLEYNPAAKDAFVIGTWNHFRVEAVGERIRTFVNGKPVADLICEFDTAGFIALQVHSISAKGYREGRQVKWKNIRILCKNVTAHMLPESHIPQVSYLENRLSELETAEGWKLIGEGPCITGRYGEFILEFDFMTTPEADAGIAYLLPDPGPDSRSEYACLYPVVDDKAKTREALGANRNKGLASLWGVVPANGKKFNPYLKKKRFNGSGKWNRARIEVRGGKTMHFLNGSKVVEYDLDQIPGLRNETEGYIMLLNPEDGAAFKNIKLKAYNKTE